MNDDESLLITKPLLVGCTINEDRRRSPFWLLVAGFNKFSCVELASDLLRFRFEIDFFVLPKLNGLVEDENDLFLLLFKVFYLI